MTVEVVDFGDEDVWGLPILVEDVGVEGGDKEGDIGVGVCSTL